MVVVCVGWEGWGERALHPPSELLVSLCVCVWTRLAAQLQREKDEAEAHQQRVEELVRDGPRALLCGSLPGLW